MGFGLLVHSGAITTNLRTLVFAPKIYIELPLWSSRRELHFWRMGFGFRSFDKKNSEVSDQYVLCCFHSSICFLYISELPLWSSMELQEGVPFLGNGILPSFIFRSCDKKFQKSPLDICYVVCILVFAPYVYFELPLGSSRR